MPLHLNPISRRGFVRGAAALAGAGLLARGAWAQNAETQNAASDRWALFSDTHIDANAELVFREANLAERLRACVAQTLALKTPPLGVIVNGDCARNDGQTGDYETFLKLLAPLSAAGLPLHVTLGNHDHRERIWAAFQQNFKQAGAAQPVQNKHVSLLAGRFANWVLLDSLDKTNVTPGLLDKEQRDWLARTLDEHADKPALVMMHHTPAENLASKGGNLQDTAELFEILQPRRHVKALLYGHSHVWDFKEKDGLHLINLPAVAYAFAKTQPTGWTDCFLAAGGGTFELRAHDEKHLKHGEKKELKWRV